MDKLQIRIGLDRQCNIDGVLERDVRERNLLHDRPRCFVYIHYIVCCHFTLVSERCSFLIQLKRSRIKSPRIKTGICGDLIFDSFV